MVQNYEELTQHLREKTEVNIQVRKTRENDNKNVKIEKMKAAMNKITEQIMSECVERMHKCSEDGYYYATLFTYNNTDMTDDFKTVFLVKGPMFNNKKTKNGTAFFEDQGIEPIIVRLNNNLTPMYCFHKYDRFSKEHSIICSWKP